MSTNSKVLFLVCDHKESIKVDPFGASTVTHEHFAMMGFEATVISRVDHDLKRDWEQHQRLQFVWRPSGSLGTDLEIFTHLMDQYSYPVAVDGIEWSWGDRPVTDLNVDTLSGWIVDNVKRRREWFQTDDVLFPWGNDFDHALGAWDFDNMDQLMTYINQRSSTYGVTVQYATLGEYFDAVYNQNLTWPTLG